MKKRQEINAEDKWNLKKMYQSTSEIEASYKKLEKLTKEIEAMEGHILDNSATFLKYLETEEELSKEHTKLYVYTYLKFYEDMSLSKSVNDKMKIDKLTEDISLRTSFASPEILSSSYEEVIKLVGEYSKYRFDLEKFFRYKKYSLSKSEEKIIAQAHNAFGTGDEVFDNLDNTDINLGTIKDESGKEAELNNSNYIEYIKSKNREVRKNAFQNMYKYFGGLNNTLTSCYVGSIKESFFTSNVRKYPSPLEASLYNDAITKNVYTNLIDTVHEFLPVMYKYQELRKKMLKLDEMHMYDIYVDLVDAPSANIPFAKGKEILFEALKPLGDKYLKDLSTAFDNGWIDKYPNEAKRSGAYQWGAYTNDPYVSLNYINNYDSVSTLAHELGHAMHSYYSNHTQEYTYHDYPIFLAEIASTINEVLIDNYFQKNAKTKEEKIYFIDGFLDKIKSTIFRQTMFAEFELIIHDKYQQGISLTPEEINNTYYELNKLYFGTSVVSDEEIKYEWSRIPHFYTPFYVYKYATGLSSALKIVGDITANKQNAKENYLEFLSAGCSDYPLNILKKCNVDMTDKKTMKESLNIFKDKLEELEKLINE